MDQPIPSQEAKPIPKYETLWSESGVKPCACRLRLRKLNIKTEKWKIHTANLLRLVSISFWSPKPLVWILLTASSFSVSHASKRHWNKIGKKKLQSGISYIYIHKNKIYDCISYNVLKNIQIYNLKKKKKAIHLLFCKMLPFTKNILQKDPSFFCPSADGCPPFSKVLETNTKLCLAFIYIFLP